MTSFQVKLSLKGKTFVLDNVTTSVSSRELHSRALAALDLPKGTVLKLLHKGKRLPTDGNDAAFASVPSKTPKILVMASSSKDVSTMATKKSDPTIRGFDQERQRNEDKNKASSLSAASVWGPRHASQDKTYKFGRLIACTWQSFGHRPTEQTPHAFEALRLLEQMATDPGVVAILRERELFVGTLGEMDPIDDRLMQTKEKEGGCLLGYNTNGGLRIDLKLRTDDLRGFRPYADLVSTLIHELSHNWVSDHNLLFWTNFGQMRAEYLHTHASLRTQLVNGQTTAALAGLHQSDLNDVLGFVMRELTVDMAQHGLHPRMIAAPLQQRCRELAQRPTGHKLGGASSSRNNNNNSGKNARELALAAAERRSRQQQQQQRNQRLDDDETMQ